MTDGLVAGRTDAAPVPAGPYSQSVRRGGLVTCAGQAGITPAGVVVAGIEAQCRQTLVNVEATLAAVGAALGDVMQVRVYLTDPDQFAVMNEVYSQVFSEPYPARTTVYVTLPPGLLVEVDALAVVGGPPAADPV